jgi:hypothetical protein
MDKEMLHYRVDYGRIGGIMRASLDVNYDDDDYANKIFMFSFDYDSLSASQSSSPS